MSFLRNRTVIGVFCILLSVPHLLRPDSALQPGGIPEGRDRPGHPADPRR